MQTGNSEPLEALEQRPASGQVKQLVFLLHGLGANGADLMGLAPIMGQLLPDTMFVSPNAPFPCDMAPFGYQWFSMQDRHEAVLLDGIRKAALILEATIAYYQQRESVSNAQTALLGFSQGSMMSLHVAPRLAEPLAAVVGFSGALVGDDYLIEEIQSRPPVCLVHGNADPVVPFARMAEAERALASAGVNVQAHERAGLEHGIDEGGLQIAVGFLQQQFEKTLEKSA